MASTLKPSNTPNIATSQLQINMLEYALAYAAQGVPVFPCKPDKSPCTKQGFKDATLDVAQIKRWWGQWPNALIAMPTGKVSGVWVLDVDDQTAFDASGIALPSTRRVKTGKGFHHYFSYDPRNSVGSLGKDQARPGTDVRGDGGYVIVPPSMHPSGVRYQWDDERPPVSAPLEIIEIVRRRSKVSAEVERKPEPADSATCNAFVLSCLAGPVWFVETALAGSQQKTLNDMTFAVGRNVLEGFASREMARASMVAAGMKMHSYDKERLWTRSQVEKIVNRALAKGIEAAAQLHLRCSDVLQASPYLWPDPASLPRRQWLFGRWLLRGEVTVALAPGGVGKSTLAVTMAVSLASGRDLIGLAPRVALGTWIYNLEDAPDELNRQVAAACMLHGVAPKECEGRLFVNSGITMPLCTATEGRDGFDINETAFAQLTETIQRQGISVVIVDPLVSSHRVSEASNEAMDAVVKRWKRLAHETGCAIMLVHHTRKLAGREVTVEDGRGASALRDAARVVLLLNRLAEEEAAKLNIGEIDRRSLIRVDMGKASRSPSENAAWFKLESQSLGNAYNGEPADDVAVAVKWEMPSLHHQTMALPVAAIQSRLTERNWRKDSQAADWVGILIAELIGKSVEADKTHLKALQAQLLKDGWLAVEERTVKGKLCPCIAVGKPFTTTSYHVEGGGGKVGE